MNSLTISDKLKIVKYFRDIVQGLPNTPSVLDHPNEEQQYFLNMYASIIKTIDGIVILLEQNKYESAFLLLRNVFEQLIALYAVSNVTKDYHKYYLILKRAETVASLKILKYSILDKRDEKEIELIERLKNYNEQLLNNPLDISIEVLNDWENDKKWLGRHLRDVVERIVPSWLRHFDTWYWLYCGAVHSSPIFLNASIHEGDSIKYSVEHSLSFYEPTLALLSLYLRMSANVLEQEFSLGNTTRTQLDSWRKNLLEYFPNKNYDV